MKETNRATIHHLNKEELHMLTTHIGKQVNIFGFVLSFASFYLVLVMQFFMDFLVLQIFVWFDAMVLKAVKDKV